MMILVLFIGVEKNGARRWIDILSFTIQPSEFLKPAFVILSAWLFSQKINRPDMPATLLAFILYAIVMCLLILQPDIGQAFLLTIVWGILFFLAGLALAWVIVLGLIVLSGLVTAYMTLPHVTKRIDIFLNPDLGNSYQVKRAIDSFLNGGWFGQGMGEGKLKLKLPDSHSDFIFAVVAEEFGLIVCLLLLGLYAFIVVRVFLKAAKETDSFIRLALVGLIVLFGFQAIINMSVNIGLMPAKGMTLPFLSYGGSSLLGMAIAMGMVIGLMRKRLEYYRGSHLFE